MSIPARTPMPAANQGTRRASMSLDHSLGVQVGLLSRR
jgi:hypothetical protein